MMTMMKYKLIILVLGAVMAFPLSSTPGQIFDKKEINYDDLFRQGISRGGKTLNLSGKKIGDEGIKVLVSHGIIKKVAKLDLRYNEITEKGAKLHPSDTGTTSV